MSIGLMILLIYITGSVILGLTPPMSMEFLDRIDTTTKTKDGKLSIWKVLKFIIIITIAIIIFIILLPAGFVNLLNGKLNLVKPKPIQIPDNNYLYFHLMGGKGHLFCKDCGHLEEIVSFLHFANSSSTGYQCQICGKHTEIKETGGFMPDLICECGGELSREEPVFCSKCRSKNVTYRMEWIT